MPPRKGDGAVTPGIADDRLRSAWAALGAGPAREPCPEPGVLFDGAAGLLPPADRDALIDHLAVCGTCSAEWRMATQLQPVQSAKVILGPARWWAAGGGIAALAALLLFVLQPMPRAPDPWRAVDDSHELATSLSNGSVLPRSAFTLSWTGGAPDDRFIVHLSGVDLDPIYASEPTAERTWTAPPEALAELPDGAALYWQVEVLAADGSRARSATFAVRLR